MTEARPANALICRCGAFGSPLGDPAAGRRRPSPDSRRSLLVRPVIVRPAGSSPINVAEIVALAFRL